MPVAGPEGRVTAPLPAAQRPHQERPRHLQGLQEVSFLFSLFVGYFLRDTTPDKDERNVWKAIPDFQIPFISPVKSQIVPEPI